MSRHEQSIHSSSHQSTSLSRRTHRTHASSVHPGRRRRHERSQSHPPNSLRDVPSTLIDIPHSVASPPFRASPSPGPEPALLPGGGIQIQQGFRLSQPDGGRFRPRAFEDGDPENGRVLGRMGLGMFKGLRKIPAAIVKAGRSYGPRNQDMSPVPETDREAEPRPEERRERVLRESPVQDDVETYMEPEEEDAPAREEQLLYEYIQRKRMSRDRAFRKRSRQERYSRSLPVRQARDVPLALVPGAHPSAEPAPVSQNAHSQTGQSNAATEAQLEAEEMRREREALEEAHERERARKIYAAEAVRQPLSSVSSDQPHMMHDSRTSQPRSASERRPPRPSSRVFSRWSAERDEAGYRKENRAEEDVITSLVSRIVRFMRQIHDLPWVGDRVAADYVPGGVKPKPRSSQDYASSPRSGVTFLSTRVHSAISDGPLPFPAVQAPATPRAGKSWYGAQEDILVLPAGVDPPPGFVPYPFPIPQSALSADGERAASASSHTHVETPPAPLVAGSSASGPGYLPGYQYVPAEVSKSGQPYILVPMGDGRHHQPLVVPEMAQYSQPGPSNSVPVSG